ncbi:hypothetical protein [Cobetia amphilecti]|uniref:hypothetical protein n=1 Tax=Cobetia amphilecti TaxID=1055104 RepID=UPI001C08D48E|nr:hypothetical protein [Cobetia amphilecti]MBU3009269.1 hypothetical protein [Cobetia amphilecti]
MDISLVVSIIGTLLSAVSLYLTYVVRRDTNFIRKSFLLRARLPETIRELTSIDKKILNSLSEWDENKNHIRADFVRSKRLAKSLLTKLNGNDQCCNDIEKYLREINEGRLDSMLKVKDSAWLAYYELSGLIVTLNQAHKDSTWE